MNRRSDIYVFSSSFTHNVIPKDKWLAFVSTTVETSNPEAELAPGVLLSLLQLKDLQSKDISFRAPSGLHVQTLFAICQGVDVLREQPFVTGSMCAAGLGLLGHIDEKFVNVVDVYEPLESGQRDKCFISKGCVLHPSTKSVHEHRTMFKPCHVS